MSSRSRAIKKRTQVGPANMRRKLDLSDEAKIGAQIQVCANGCWEWTGTRSPQGYGQARVANRTVPAHRFVYKTLRGWVPDEYVMHHKCENPPCVNPDHLEPMLSGDHIAHHAALRKNAAAGHQ